MGEVNTEENSENMLSRFGKYMSRIKKDLLNLLSDKHYNGFCSYENRPFRQLRSSQNSPYGLTITEYCSECKKTISRRGPVF